MTGVMFQMYEASNDEYASGLGVISLHKPLSRSGGGINSEQSNCMVHHL